MRFACDRMLVGVGKWLRAAGYDVAIAAERQDDRDVLRQARAEGRILLTCDRSLKCERAADDESVVLLASSAPETAAPDLARRLAVDWEHAPFSRCMEDGALLHPASEAQARAVPHAARALPGPIMACPHCRRVYWQGSHVARMRRTLARWKEAAAAPAVE